MRWPVRARMLLGAGLLWAGTVWGWGDAGHRIVGEIAWEELPDAVRARVVTLLPAGEQTSLADAATWADRVARGAERYAWLAPFHHVEIQSRLSSGAHAAAGPSASGYLASRDCPDGRCVVAGIARFADELGDPSAGAEQRLLALRMLAHLVGDVHQPLHVGHRDGKGGNATFALFFGENKSLHSIWDSGLLERGLRRRELDWRGLAHRLRASIDPADRQAWKTSAPPAWADESLALGRRLADPIEDGEPLGQAYLDETWPEIERRLQMAGVRLAALLERALDAPAAPIPTIEAANAASYVGQVARVCGRVVATHFARSTRGEPTFLNLDRPHPDPAFTVVIWGRDRAAFGRPEETFEGQRVCVTGVVESHRGRPQIVVRSPDALASEPAAKTPE